MYCNSVDVVELVHVLTM